MKQPLSRAQSIGRELVCFVAGHKWKCSWHRIAIAVTDEYETLPYKVRQGNPYFEHSAGWTYKCSRCRERIHGEMFLPFYIDYYNATKAAIFSVRSAWRLGHRDEHIEIKSKGWFVTWCALSGMSQFFMHICSDRHWPMFLADLACDVEWKVAEKAFVE